MFRGRRIAQDPLHVAHLEVRPDERMIRVALLLGLLEQLPQAFSGVFQQVLAQRQRTGPGQQLALDAGDHVVQGFQRQLEPLPGLVAGSFRPSAFELSPVALVLGLVPGSFRVPAFEFSPVTLELRQDRKAACRHRQCREGRDRRLPQPAIAPGLFPGGRNHLLHSGLQLESRGLQLLRLLQGLPRREQQVGPPALLQPSRRGPLHPRLHTQQFPVVGQPALQPPPPRQQRFVGDADHRRAIARRGRTRTAGPQ